MLPLHAVGGGGRPVPAVVVAFLDDATKLFVHAEAYGERSVDVVEDCFKKAVLRCGLPMAVRLDHGLEFAAEPFMKALERLAVRVVEASPVSPEPKGKSERLFSTLQTGLVPDLQALEEPLTIAAINRRLGQWVEEIYHNRVHGELPEELPTPRLRWDRDPTPLRQVDPIRLEAAFLLRAQRKVGRTQLVEVGGRRYLTDQVRAGAMVEVRYHPLRPERLQVWLDDQFVQYAYPYVIPEDVPAQSEGYIPVRGESGHNLAKMWLADYEASAAQQHHAAAFTPPPFTADALLAMLQQALGHVLEPFEEQRARQLWHMFGRLDAELTARGISRMVAQHGKGLHIGYYLEGIADQHRRWRGLKSHV